MLEDEAMKTPRATRQSALVHLAAGGAGGTAGAILTCPLEVIKTRLQSSVPVFRLEATTMASRLEATTMASLPGGYTVPAQTLQKPAGVVACTRHIVQTEGVKSLFRGLGPNLVGVAPARAIYFSAYANTKKLLNNCGKVHCDSSFVHFLSGISAGVASTTSTSPIWVVKTRLQLDNRPINRFGVWNCVQEIYAKDGLRGFYRGLSASYFGVSETVIHLVIYERIKATINCWSHANQGYVNQPSLRHFLEYMVAASISKSIACTLTYPHEVVRTRLRQEEADGLRKYRSFMQTLKKVSAEEGFRGLYGGLTTQLFRQIPNTGVIFLTYEIILSYFDAA